ncbi:uncharacterized protein AAEQ78_022486 [Lycaon pictus]
MCVQGQKRGLPSACGRTRSHPVTTRADRLTFPPSDDFHNRLTSISLILKTRLEGSHKSTVPRRGGGPACVTRPGDLAPGFCSSQTARVCFYEDHTNPDGHGNAGSTPEGELRASHPWPSWLCRHSPSPRPVRCRCSTGRTKTQKACAHTFPRWEMNKSEKHVLR